MPDIRYVCLSDTHFGADNSLLTNLQTASSNTAPTQPSPVLEKLVECLRYLIAENESPTKPILILNGDIVEMALTTANEAAMAFERFIDLIMADGQELFERIIYLPGNHDHHLWETARETQYAEFLKSKVGWGEYLEIPWHATNMFTNPVPSYFLNRLLQRRPNLKDLTVETAYPNFGLLSPDRSRAVIFHHGHFVEPIYLLMSTLKTMIFPERPLPREVWDFEAENFAWIDFFWSTLGRSGEVGQGVGIIFEKLQDDRQTKKLLVNLSRGLAEKYDLPGWGDRMEAKFLEWALWAIAGQVHSLERQRDTGRAYLSEDAEKGLWFYLEEPLRRQIQLECQGTMPDKVTFVFGHIHKPFEEDMNFHGYPEWTEVYNSGGWVVDTVEPQPLHGGAVVLVDENLNAASVRFYNEFHNPEDYRVTVGEARHPGEPRGPMFERLSVLIRANPNLFRSFSDAVARAVHVRAQNIRARINRERWES
jgi:hypothetical protein